MNEKTYYRPLCETSITKSPDALKLAGGWVWFSRVEMITRNNRQIIPASDLPDDICARLTAPRPSIAGLHMDRPRIMGIVNTTPDSFSDGGRFDDLQSALTQAQALITAGADILDIGGESTRPGAAPVDIDVEITRTAPLIKAIDGIPISIDTRKAKVAIAAKADMINDVSALGYDPNLARFVADQNLPICLMHSQGDPETMQDNPFYNNVLLDVYDALEARLHWAVDQGIRRDQIILDPGIGFGKTLDHNLELLRGLSLFHALGCPILLGASRKRFIGAIAGVERADQRIAGSISVALAGIAQGVQITRVHDVGETVQAVKLWDAVNT